MFISTFLFPFNSPVAHPPFSIRVNVSLVGEHRRFPAAVSCAVGIEETEQLALSFRFELDAVKLHRFGDNDKFHRIALDTVSNRPASTRPRTVSKKLVRANFAMGKMKSTETEETTAMGFKDKQKALDTLKALDGRDISYQYHVITSFVSRTKRTLQITKDEEKLVNLREALKVFEDWLTNYKEKNRGKENLPYLPFEIVKSFGALAKRYDVLDDEFLEAYKREKGDYKGLRTVKVPEKNITWDIERNRRLKEIIDGIKERHVQWYETDVGDFRGLPTKEHVRCIMLAYSPDPSKVKKLVSRLEEAFGFDSDERSERDESLERDESMEVEEQERKGKDAKRKREGDSTSSDSETEEPERKVAKRSNDEDKSEKDEDGLGFRDREKALRSIESLNGRDVTYQYHAIAGLIKRAERVISCTKDERKIENMKAAVETFQRWITDYEVNSRAKENFGYLSVDLMRAFQPLADRYRIEDNGFLKAYEEADGDCKKLRTIRIPDSKITWDVERNKNLRNLVERIEARNGEWFETNGEFAGLPTEDHVRCIMWAFGRDVDKLEQLLPTLTEKLKS